jgi:ribonucleoside-diphosphate reductase beta chain
MENLHLSATQTILKRLPEEDEDFKIISLETKKICQKMFVSVVEQEEAWADYLFKDASMIGLNASILKEYVRWIASKRMSAIGITCPFQVSAQNPLPWTVKWISGSKSSQVSPQETEILSYLSGDVHQDMDEEKVKSLDEKFKDI